MSREHARPQPPAGSRRHGGGAGEPAPVPVGVTGHQTQRPGGQVGPPGPHPAQPSSLLDPGGERGPIVRPLAPLIAQLVAKTANQRLSYCRWCWLPPKSQNAAGGSAAFWHSESPQTHRSTRTATHCRHHIPLYDEAKRPVVSHQGQRYSPSPSRPPLRTPNREAYRQGQYTVHAGRRAPGDGDGDGDGS
jgi:hypothetical protein